jgi:hypothetical protein
MLEDATGQKRHAVGASRAREAAILASIVSFSASESASASTLSVAPAGLRLGGGFRGRGRLEREPDRGLELRVAVLLRREVRAVRVLRRVRFPAPRQISWLQREEAAGAPADFARRAAPGCRDGRLGLAVLHLLVEERRAHGREARDAPLHVVPVMVRAIVRACALCQIGAHARGGRGWRTLLVGGRERDRAGEAREHRRVVHGHRDRRRRGRHAQVVDGMEKGGEEEEMSEEQKVEAPLK